MRVVSGAQTGVDRAALDVAIELDIAHGGWCPRGRRAEDGRIASHYLVQETPQREYWARTERNVTDSDATLILYRTRMTGGTELTYRMTVKHARPCLCVDLEGVVDEEAIDAWLQEQSIKTLNVAGPRESTCPGIYEQARQLLSRILSRCGVRRSSV